MRTERPTVTITTRKKPGPRSISTTDQPPADVHLTLAPEDYDAAYKIAARERISVPELLRQALRAFLQR